MDTKLDRAKDPAAILQDDELVGRALEKAARQAVADHKREGLPLAMSRDGEVAWVSAEELEAEIDEPS
jgi:hypothetical protein